MYNIQSKVNERYLLLNPDDLDGKELNQLSPRTSALYILKKTTEKIENDKAKELPTTERFLYSLQKMSDKMSNSELEKMTKKEIPYLIKQHEGIYSPEIINDRINGIFHEISDGENSEENLDYFKKYVLILKQDRELHAPLLNRTKKLCNNIDNVTKNNEEKTNVVSSINKVLKKSINNHIDPETIKDNYNELFDSIRYKYIEESLEINQIMPKFLKELKNDLKEKYPKDIEYNLDMPPEKTAFQKFHMTMAKLLPCFYLCQACDTPKNIIESEMPVRTPSFKSEDGREFDFSSTGSPNMSREKQESIHSEEKNDNDPLKYLPPIRQFMQRRSVAIHPRNANLAAQSHLNTGVPKVRKSNLQHPLEEKNEDTPPNYPTPSDSSQSADEKKEDYPLCEGIPRRFFSSSMGHQEFSSAEKKDSGFLR